MRFNVMNLLAYFSWPALLGGCATAGSPDPPPAAPPPVAATAPAAAEEAPAASDAFYSYSAIGKRDPFRDLFTDLGEVKPGAKLQPLERYDIDQLKLVAVVVGMAAPRAMIEDPSGKGHVVKIGALLGKHGGQVRHIRPDSIVVREEFRTHDGRRYENLISLRLPAEQLEPLE